MFIRSELANIDEMNLVLIKKESILSRKAICYLCSENCIVKFKQKYQKIMLESFKKIPLNFIICNKERSKKTNYIFCYICKIKINMKFDQCRYKGN